MTVHLGVISERGQLLRPIIIWLGLNWMTMPIIIRIHLNFIFPPILFVNIDNIIVHHRFVISVIYIDACHVYFYVFL